ncbi:MAG: pilus (MSHA type) biogenesis protein MshL [Sulfurimonas sp.]|uniref:pilus (MSHA type) biogenesis protein MshL n=1 Tax=Sulfurimonas sp. TaxID=2022749 RepID=UPI0025ED7E74|nr:pilus (MSHA type) biogenesis protein MshL [Sulfurimonas sp.]MCK9454819.1 pilus (MSHA type) biogenesis protein MshL [Sulfurimonas sp.]
MKLIKTTVYSTLLTLILSANALADCSYELFSISSTKDTKIIDFIEQLSDECEFSIIVTDPNAQKFLDSSLNKTNLNNLTIDEVLNLILKENNLTYTLENNILKISYLQTRMFNIDYILSQRKSESKTNITLSSEGAGVASATTAMSTTTTTTDTAQDAGGGSAGKSGMNINSSDEVEFWHNLDLELQSVLNRPQDVYVAEAPIINKNAGIITVTSTIKQMERLEKYLTKLQDKVQLQVLIDVQLLSVTLSDGKTTGVDWSQLYKLQDIDISIDKLFHKNVSEFEDGKITTALAGGGASENSHLIEISASGNLNEVIKFLKTQGDVTSISNPKVLTLNNQAALITAGTEYFYKIISTETLSGTTSGTQSTNEDLQSVFAGVLLDITPEISDDDMITLKVNPSLSETASDISLVDSSDRTMPPDLRRRQLSSVVTVRNGNRIILGGLISTSNNINMNKVPILGDIPILNYLFKYEDRQKITQELVIVIEPHIVRKNDKKLSLSDLGYEGLSEDVLLNAKAANSSPLSSPREEN